MSSPSRENNKAPNPDIVVYIELNGASMTKADIVEIVAEKCGISKKESIGMVESVFSLLKTTLESGENLKISGFGNFEVRQKADRLGRNPQTGETITIEARRVLTFKPSSVLRRAVNGGTK